MKCSKALCHSYDGSNWEHKSDLVHRTTMQCLEGKFSTSCRTEVNFRKNMRAPGLYGVCIHVCLRCIDAPHPDDSPANHDAFSLGFACGPPANFDTPFAASTTCTPTTPSSRTCAPRGASSRRPADAAGPTDSRYELCKKLYGRRRFCGCSATNLNVYTMVGIDAMFGVFLEDEILAWINAANPMTGGMPVQPTPSTAYS